MLEDDETGVEGRDVAHDVFPVLQNLCRCDSSSGDIEVCKGVLDCGKPA